MTSFLCPNDCGTVQIVKLYNCPEKHYTAPPTWKCKSIGNTHRVLFIMRLLCDLAGYQTTTGIHNGLTRNRPKETLSVISVILRENPAKVTKIATCFIESNFLSMLLAEPFDIHQRQNPKVDFITVSRANKMMILSNSICRSGNFLEAVIRAIGIDYINGDFQPILDVSIA